MAEGGTDKEAVLGREIGEDEELPILYEYVEDEASIRSKWGDEELELLAHFASDKEITRKQQSPQLYWNIVAEQMNEAAQQRGMPYQTFTGARVRWMYEHQDYIGSREWVRLRGRKDQKEVVDQRDADFRVYLERARKRNLKKWDAVDGVEGGGGAEGGMEVEGSTSAQ